MLPPAPVSRTFGFDRGKPIDRWYIERFLAEHAADVRGRVLEVAESTYTGWYGGDDVTTSDILYAAEGNPEATVVGDLTTGEGIRRPPSTASSSPRPSSSSTTRGRRSPARARSWRRGASYWRPWPGSARSAARTCATGATGGASRRSPPSDCWGGAASARELIGGRQRPGTSSEAGARPGFLRLAGSRLPVKERGNAAPVMMMEVVPISSPA